MQRIIVPLSASLLLAGLALGVATGCHEEGPAERAGRQIDEAVEETREAGEGTLEELGREVDEAVKESKEAADEIKDAADEAS